jgi:hypothetical protein
MDNRFRKVHQDLGKTPGIGGFPAEQIFPWSFIALSGVLIGNQLLKLSWLWTGVIIAWGIATWWVLTGSKPWRFLSKFVGTPDLVRGYGRYKRMVDNVQENPTKPKAKNWDSPV